MEALYRMLSVCSTAYYVNSLHTIIISAALKVSLTRNTKLHWGMAGGEDDRVFWGPGGWWGEECYLLIFHSGRPIDGAWNAKVIYYLEKRSYVYQNCHLDKMDGWRDGDGEKVIGVVSVLDHFQNHWFLGLFASLILIQMANVTQWTRSGRRNRKLW